MSAPFRQALGAHRQELLRHCYRMLGSFADAEDLAQDAMLKAWRARKTFEGTAPLRHWLLRIATNECLNALARRRRLTLPQLEREPAGPGSAVEQLEAAHWLTPAPDAALFADSFEARETVALAFVAFLQRLPPRQRAVLLLKDVVGWPTDEIATALEISLSSASSALHRARQTLATAKPQAFPETPPEVLREYVRSWEERDLEGLVALLRRDVVFAMPPHATWFRGARAVERFVQTPRFAAFWATGLRVVLTRANGQDALAFFLRSADGSYARNSVQLVRFAAGKLAEATTFIGAGYLRGFDVPSALGRTVSEASLVLKEQGAKIQ